MFCGGKSGFVKAKHNFVQMVRALRGIYLQNNRKLIEMKIGQIAIAVAMMAVSCCVANAALRVQYKGFTPTASVNVAVEDLREMAGRADAEGLARCVFELDKRVGGGEFGYELQNGSVTFHGGDEASWTNI